MENKFADAYFGKQYKTRDGLVALFIDQNDLGEVTYVCQPKGYIYCERHVKANGFCLPGVEDPSDIIFE